MKKLLTFVTVVLSAFAFLIGLATPSLAGGDASLTVELAVTGPVPAGTVFTVDLNCGTAPNEATTTITFDDEGNPEVVGENVVTWGPVLGPAFDCTPTQQAIADATVAYSCTDSAQATECTSAGPQDQPIVVEISGTGSATLTITNAYAELPPETTPTTGAGASGAGVSPTFTG